METLFVLMIAIGSILFYIFIVGIILNGYKKSNSISSKIFWIILMLVTFSFLFRDEVSNTQNYNDGGYDDNLFDFYRDNDNIFDDQLDDCFFDFDED